MKQFIESNWFKLSLILITMITISSIFYWFEWRPAKIKHDCSWVRKHSDAVTQITQEQYDKCCRENQEKSPFSDRYYCSYNCTNPRSAKPANDWHEPASSTYYGFCIHEKGI
jgi:hypothetical protein